MPKAILEFNLPEEREEFELAQKAAELSSILSEIDNILRNASKYGLPTELVDQYMLTTEESRLAATSAIDWIRSEFNKLRNQDYYW